MTFVRVCFIAALFLVPAPASANSEDFVKIYAAGLVDDQCHVYKFTERTILNTVANQALAEEPRYQKWLDGSLDNDRYYTWFDELISQATTLAQSLACDATAGQLLNAVRGPIASRLYQDLVLATYFHGLSSDDLDRVELTADQIAAAQAFDGFMQQLYGTNYAQFSEANKQAVQALIPPPVLSEFGLPYGGGMDLDAMEAQRKVVQELQSRARGTIATVVLELTAERNGMFVRSDSGGAPLLVQSDEQIWAIIHRGPVRLTDGPKVYVNAVLASLPDHTIRLMAYGNAEAINSAFLLVGKGPSTANGGTEASTGDPEWRAEANSYTGRPLETGCLGDGCFEFPPEAYDALMAIARMDYAELVVSSAIGTNVPAPDGGSQNRVFAASLQDFVQPVK